MRAWLAQWFGGGRSIEDAVARHLDPLRRFLEAHVKAQEGRHVEHKAKAEAHARLARDAKDAADKARGIAGGLAGLLK